MSKDTYFFDTINAVKNYDAVIGGISSMPYHPYNLYFPFKYPLKNVKRITLKSVEMPLNLYNIRVENGSVKIGVTFSYSTYTNVYINFQIPAATYTISSLITMLNSQLSSSLTPYSGLSIVFSTLSTYVGTLCQITNNCTSLTLDNTPLTNYILGYNNKFTSTGGALLISTSPINLYGIDTCLYITFPNLPNTNNNNNFTGFKLQLSNIYNSILTINDYDEHQTLYFNNTPFILDKINVLVVDRLGTPTIGYFNWTMSLIIEYDDKIEQHNDIKFLNFNN